MFSRATSALAAVVLFLAPAVSQADLASYSQNFESLTQSDPAALANDGWLVYGNVFDLAHNYLYGYGSFPAPNGTGAFCAIDAGQGGPAQGVQQLSVYSDYNNSDQATRLIEANVYHEQQIGVADVGEVYIFRFDAKRGNLVSPTEALAFIKTLDPNAGYATTNFITYNTTGIPTDWGTYSISITITPGLVGQILQFGFNSTTTNYAGSGVFYDNISFARDMGTPTVSGTWGRLKGLYK